jgi:hypothetical protein
MESDRAEALALVEATTADRRSADQAAAAARDAQSDAIRLAVTAGVPATQVRDATGFSLARIYQIRDGRR